MSTIQQRTLNLTMYLYHNLPNPEMLRLAAWFAAGEAKRLRSEVRDALLEALDELPEFVRAEWGSDAHAYHELAPNPDEVNSAAFALMAALESWNGRAAVPADVTQRARELMQAFGFEMCPVCGTVHPPVGSGQPLLLPRIREHAELVIRAHARDMVHRAGDDGIAAGDILGRLVGA